MKHNFLLFIGIAFLFCGCQSASPKKEKEVQKNIRLSISDDPSTIDPRIARDLNAITAVRMLFEGLIRPGFDQNIEMGMAAHVEISEDLLKYTFTLREDANWSNGDPVTSEDFAYAWKTILTPSFPASNAYQFFLIRGAKEAKEGKKSLNDVGIYTPDPKTLVIELEQPCPYFLELTSFHAFFPVHKKFDQENPKWSEGITASIIGNGPFSIDQWKRHDLFSVKKNPSYWDTDRVKIDGVKLYVLEENTALQLFETGGLEWAGSPLSVIPADAMESLNQRGTLETALAAGTAWLRFNTSSHPLDHPKIRKALSYSIDRDGIVKSITQGNQIPATKIVPPQLGLSQQGAFEDHNLEFANKLYQEALEELDIQELPVITLHYAASDRSHKIAQALQQQWQSALPINIELQSSESKMFFSNVAMGDYQIAIGSWFADFRDPINFLDIFKSKANRTNSTYWENPMYVDLLELSSKEPNPALRNHLLSQAENILIDEMPVAPLYFYTFNYIKREQLKGILLSDLGFMDFKYATYEVK